MCMHKYVYIYKRVCISLPTHIMRTTHFYALAILSTQQLRWRIGCVSTSSLEHPSKEATHCKKHNTLQHTATHCNTLQHTATRRNKLQHRHRYNMLQRIDALMCVSVSVCMFACMYVHVPMYIRTYMYIYRHRYNTRQRVRPEHWCSACPCSRCECLSRECVMSYVISHVRISHENASCRTGEWVTGMSHITHVKVCHVTIVAFTLVFTDIRHDTYSYATWLALMKHDSLIWNMTHIYYCI